MTTCPRQQALTRPRFDDFHQIDDMRITSYAARYYLNPPAANCPTNFVVNSTTRLQKNGDSWVAGQWRTDVESDLRGVGRFSTRVRSQTANPETQFDPRTNAMTNKALEHAPDENFPMTFARLTAPPCTLRATGWNRWQPLFHNPQETFETPFDFFIPSRDLDKEKCRSH